MSLAQVRVRFAPAPTGMMHLGNVRAALMNFLFAQQKKGIFVLRIEDTDAQRNYDPQAQEIIKDLHWLHLCHNEGPQEAQPYGPYFQSQRTHLYQENLQKLIEKQLAYRCFCSEEILEKKRKRQQALKQPPRYDRTCLSLSTQEINDLAASKTPFIWRFKLDSAKTVTIQDLAHGNTSFELHNFSDFPLTRSDGSFTFIFANFVDDMLMKITHIFRGEDHLTNTACQASLFEAFGIPLPIYWHMPILCNIEGKKLSKRDFGFSLRDLQNAGYLPEAITNYLGIIGGSFAQEIMSLEELAHTINFEGLSTTGQIKYDVEKLQWVNRKWIATYDNEQLISLCLPYLTAVYQHINTTPKETLISLITIIKTEMVTLQDAVSLLSFYFNYQAHSVEQLNTYIQQELQKQIITLATNHLKMLSSVDECDTFLASLKKSATDQKIPLQQLYHFLRLALSGQPKGPSIKELIGMLNVDEAKRRIEKTLALLKS